jgi:hypothetical protein
MVKDDLIELGTVKQACKIVGGEDSPIHPSTYYRLVKQGIYEGPKKVGPNISRVNLTKLRRQVRETMSAPTA